MMFLKVNTPFIPLKGEITVQIETNLFSRYPLEGIIGVFLNIKQIYNRSILNNLFTKLPL